MSQRLNRRRFLQTTAAVGAGYWFTATARSAARAADGPNGKIRMGCIGVGGKGGSDTDHAGDVGQIVALCDIDEGTLNGKAEKFPDAKKFFDFRKMLEEMSKQIDAVTVSTPDHTHAPAAVMAMRMGKHVYCQKPLTYTVQEARTMREVAKKAGVCTQMGNQGSAHNTLRRGVEVVHAGIIGPVREAHVWTNRPVWPQAPSITKRPAESPVPANVHWDEWIGPAPFRPYSGPSASGGSRGSGGASKTPRGAYHDFNWRGWWDFGTGALGDMACHTANLAHRALKLGFPTSVVADATDLNSETYPSSAHVTFEFPARGDLPPVTFHWYEGKRNNKRVLPDEMLKKLLKAGEQAPASASILVGEKGILYSPQENGNKWVLIGEGLEEAAKNVPQTLPRNSKDDLGMKQEWAEAIKAGKPSIAFSNFDIAGMLTETILLGNIAIKLNGQKLMWDGPSLQFTNNSAANNAVHYEYRKGWTL